MHSRIAWLVVVAMVAGLSQSSSAVMQPGTFTQYGNYGVSCGKFTSSPETQREAYRAWLMGFVSGAGYGYSMKGTMLAETDYRGGTAWIDKYCTEHPLDEIAVAAVALVKELAARRR